MNGVSGLRSRYARRWAGIVLAATLAALFIGGSQRFAVNLIPVPWDKLAHLALFFCMTIILIFASGAQRKRALFACGALVLLIGAIDEWHQLVLPGRSPGWDDFAADAAGVLTGLGVIRLMQRPLQSIKP